MQIGAYLWVARYGHYSICKLLLDNGVDCNIKESFSRSTPLHIAAAEGHLTLCQLLLERGAAKDVQDFHGETPIHGAASGGFVAVCRVCLQKLTYYLQLDYEN